MFRLKVSGLIRIGMYMIKGAIIHPRYSAFNPSDLTGFIKNPQPVYLDMLKNKNIFFAPTQLAWIITPPYNQYRKLLTHSDLTFNFNAWDYFPHINEHKKRELDHICEVALPRLSIEGHKKIRKVANKAFAPRFVQKIEGDIEAIVENVLAEVEEIFDMDAVLEKVTFLILTEYVGVPAELRDECEDLYHQIISCFLDPLGSPDYDNAEKGIAVLKALINQKKINPSDDFLSALVNASEDGESLSEIEILGLIATLLAVGPDTIRDNMVYFFYNLEKNPETRTELINNPELINNAIYESMRWNGSGYCGNTRFVVNDFEFEGITIKKGEMIKIMANAAFHDSDEFPEPHLFDLHRENVTDIPVYGGGPHYCLGHALASTSMRIIALKVLAMFPNYSLVEEPEHELNPISRRMTSLMLNSQQSVAASKLKDAA